MVGPQYDSRWISRHSLQLKSALVAHGIRDDMLARSSWSAKCPARAKGATCVAYLGATDEEFSVGTDGLLCILLWFTTGKAKVRHAGNVAAQLAGEFITSLCMKALPSLGPPFTVSWSGGSVDLQWTGTRLVMLSCSPARRWEKMMATFLCDGNIGRMLVHMKEKLQRPSRIKGHLDLVATLLATLLQVIGCSVEQSRHSEVWDAMRPCSVPALFRDGSTKARRLSLGYVLDVADVVSNSPELRTSSQYLASQAAQACSPAARGKTNSLKTHGKTKALAPKTGRSFCSRKLLAYRAGPRASFRGSRYLSVALDGTRVGGAEWCQYACTDPATGKSAWLPPQASVGTKFGKFGNAKTHTCLVRFWGNEMSLCPSPPYYFDMYAMCQTVTKCRCARHLCFVFYS